MPSSFGPAVGKDENAAGAVEAVRYAESPSREHSDPKLKLKGASPSWPPGLLGTNMAPVAGNTWLVIVAALAGGR